MAIIEIGFIVTLFVAAIAIEISNKLKLPSSVGLILIGIFLGPSFFSIIESSEIIQFLASVGLTLLLFKVGLESDLSFLKSKSSIAVGFFGLLVPWLMGFGLIWLFGFSFSESFFVGVILTATSIGITVAVMNELGVLERDFARVIIGAAVVDDILGLMALSIASSLVLSQKFDFYSVGEHVAFSLVIIFISLFLGIRVVSAARRVTRFRIHKSAADLLIIGAAFLAAVLAEKIGFSGIIGAFLTGLVISETSRDKDDKRKVASLVDPLVILFSPLFFLNLGLLINFSDLMSGFKLGILLSVIAIISKYIGSYYPAKFTGLDKTDSMLVGFGMLPRGEVALVAAQLGLSFGVISPTIFSAVIIMALITSIFPPVIFLYLLSPSPVRLPGFEEIKWKFIYTSITMRDLTYRIKEKGKPHLKKIGFRF